MNNQVKTLKKNNGELLLVVPLVNDLEYGICIAYPMHKGVEMIDQYKNGIMNGLVIRLNY